MEVCLQVTSTLATNDQWIKVKAAATPIARGRSVRGNEDCGTASLRWHLNTFYLTNHSRLAERNQPGSSQLVM